MVFNERFMDVRTSGGLRWVEWPDSRLRGAPPPLDQGRAFQDGVLPANGTLALHHDYAAASARVTIQIHTAPGLALAACAGGGCA
jgi:hypothetical protein